MFYLQGLLFFLILNWLPVPKIWEVLHKMPDVHVLCENGLTSLPGSERQLPLQEPAEPQICYYTHSSPAQLFVRSCYLLAPGDECDPINAPPICTLYFS